MVWQWRISMGDFFHRQNSTQLTLKWPNICKFEGCSVEKIFLINNYMRREVIMSELKSLTRLICPLPNRTSFLGHFCRYFIEPNSLVAVITERNSYRHITWNKEVGAIMNELGSLTHFICPEILHSAKFLRLFSRTFCWVIRGHLAQAPTTMQQFA